MLEIFGLDVSAQEVYQAMLAEPGLGVTELSDHLGRTEGQIRAALDALADAALLRASREHPGRLRAVDPGVGLDLLVRRQEEELARRQQDLAASKAAAANAVAAFAHLRPNTEVGGAIRLVGLDAVHARIEAMAATVGQEVLAVTPGPSVPAETLEGARVLDAGILARGVRIRVLYQDSVRNDPATHAYAGWLTDLGGQVRTAPLLPPRLLVYDQETALVPIDPGDNAAGALCTSEPGILASLVALFEQAWDAAVPLGADRTRDAGEGLSPGERELLKLLAGGITDESAAKRLGVSLRTVRRQMSALMERLDASSRFEAGLKAAQRGWL